MIPGKGKRHRALDRAHRRAKRYEAGRVRQSSIRPSSSILGHTPRLKITAMYAKRGPENLVKGLAAVDQYLKELRSLIEARPTESTPELVCG